MTATDFIKERAVNLTVAALAPFDAHTRIHLITAALLKVALISDQDAKELQDAILFSTMRVDMSDEAVLDTLQISYAQKVFELVNRE